MSKFGKFLGLNKRLSQKLPQFQRNKSRIPVTKNEMPELVVVYAQTNLPYPSCRNQLGLPAIRDTLK